MQEKNYKSPRDWILDSFEVTTRRVKIPKYSIRSHLRRIKGATERLLKMLYGAERITVLSNALYIDKKEVVDALADLLVVTTGTAIAFEFSEARIFFGKDNSGVDSNHYAMVEEFMRRCNQIKPLSHSQTPSKEVKQLRAALIQEELEELYLKGFGIDVYFGGISKAAINPRHVAKALGIIEIELMALLHGYGFPVKEVLRIVDENNLAKFGPGHSMREDGKLIKATNHYPPEWKGVIPYD